ncbi:glycerol-1-phosphate dehydrogenase (NAD(P)+) [Candidatus Xenohaliotis californiensis]|uniref:Glycerol-1-phosphate dehydrogenase (NAD(P)+) n=1 Tax=Candidatus Xenohaliotis californiensis TaxID=84677 RepID=A0ABM9N9E5_9RICK|nr:glycerol-1-phosphate dehydrogenase (NAD(P)+) [Candidatus Xenohaliotis californiensis]
MPSTCFYTISEQLVFKSNGVKLPDIPIVMCGSLISNLKSFISSQSKNDDTYILICDSALYDIIGMDLRKTINCEVLVLGERPKRTVQLAQEISLKFAQYSYALILGSGTVVDLGKYAATLAGKPFFVLPTAPSSTSYSSTFAVLYNNGVVEFLHTSAPSAIYVDINLIAEAPVELIISGLSECLAFYTLEIDWLISHLTFGEKYNAEVYNFLLQYLDKVFAASQQIVLHNKSALVVLMNCLLAAGLVIGLSDFSYLFQSVYNISNVLKSLYGCFSGINNNKHLIVNTSLIYRLQKYLLNEQIPVMYNNPVALDTKLGIVIEQLERKNAVDFRELNYKIAVSWEMIKNRLATMPDIAKLYRDIGLNYNYRDLFISKNAYIKSVQTAPFMVSSFSSLDIAMYVNPELIAKFI